MEESFNLGVFKRDFDLEYLLNYLWCDIILLVIGSDIQILWEKLHNLAQLKLWNCIPHIIRG